jgi:hypothetical protein
MKRSLLTYFAWISLALTGFSCRSPQVLLTGNQQDTVKISSDSVSSGMAVFKADVLYRDKELTGRILVKKADADHYKVAFYNEMGMTYLEGTLEKKNLVVKNIIPALDNKLFLKKFSRSLIKVL